MNQMRLSIVPHGRTWAVKCGEDFIGVTRRLEDAVSAMRLLAAEARAEGREPEVVMPASETLGHAA